MLREGETYTLPREPSAASGSSSAALAASLQYKLVMSAPVQQGIARRGTTKVYVSAPPALDEDISEDAIPDIPDGDFDELSGSEAGEFDIGEDFLAGSVLRPLSLPASPAPSPNGDKMNGATNGTHTADGNLHLSHAERTYRAHALQRQVSRLEDECAVYVRTSELSRIGVLDGEWVRPLYAHETALD